MNSTFTDTLSKPQRPQILNTILSLSQSRAQTEQEAYKRFLHIADRTQNDVYAANLTIITSGRFQAPASYYVNTYDEKETVQNGSLFHIFQ